MSVSKENNVRVRFAPSPTGMLHVGGARTALFNYLFARANNGKYLLRVEDSDRQRSTPEAVEAIMKGLQWLGITPDEEIVYQSNRNELYLDTVRKMLANGHAYPCDVSMQELDRIRDEQKSKGLKPRYDGRCRPANFTPQDTTLPTSDDQTPFVIRIRMPDREAIEFNDAILGKIVTSMDELDDFILIRSDGTPTYNLVNAIDDIEMGITHVLRGNEHVANTPKQIAVYEAIDAKLPIFAHFPLILGPDKKKLSKRHGATAVFQYRDEGFLADAFVNYLARLGWSAGDQELFSRPELESSFSLSGVGKSPSVFDTEKLRWVNAEHMQKLEVEPLMQATLAYFEDSSAVSSKLTSEFYSNPACRTLIDEVRQRSRTLVEMASGLRWVFSDSSDIKADEKDRKKFFKESIAEAWSKLISSIEVVDDFSAAELEKNFTAFLEKHDLSFGKLGQPVRIALTGEKGGVPIFLAMQVLGKEQSVKRLRNASSYFTDS